MKPLGTITKYYGFVDEESKAILSSLMDESSSYFDFVQRLSDVVLENEVSVNLAYIAAVQAWWARAKKPMSLIHEKYKDMPCISPWGYVHAGLASDQMKYHDTVVESIERAIDASVADWMATELHLLHSFFHWPNYGDIPSRVEPLEKAKRLIDADPLLNCFEPLVYVFEGTIREREGDAEGALVAYQRALDLSEANDDILLKYMALLSKANAVKQKNTKESLAVFEKIYELTQDLKAPYFVGEVLNDSALAFEIAGEYDLAISCHHECINVYGLMDITCLNLSRIYSILGLGQESLEWANRALECAGNSVYSTLYIRKAWALSLLNRLEEAERNLDIAYPMVIKAGTNVVLESYCTVSGIVELARGDYLDALDTLEKALETAERYSGRISQNIILLYLARVELALDQKPKDSTMSLAPGKWLSGLENYAVENDLPGMRMQAALLMSEFYQYHRQLRDALSTLQQALEISDSPGVRTLTKRIINRIQELNRLVCEEGTASVRK